MPGPDFGRVRVSHLVTVAARQAPARPWRRDLERALKCKRAVKVSRRWIVRRFPFCYHQVVSKSQLSIRIDSEEKAALERLAQSQDLTVGQLVRKVLKKVVADTNSGIPVAPQLEVSRSEGCTGTVRDSELSWLEEHVSELSELAGQYLIIEGERLVAHGRDPLEVLRKAQELGVRVPFIVRAPERLEGYSIGL